MTLLTEITVSNIMFYTGALSVHLFTNRSLHEIPAFATSALKQYTCQISKTWVGKAPQPMMDYLGIVSYTAQQARYSG